jgi:hypothetical protein
VRIRGVLSLLALALTAGSSSADIFWFTQQAAPTVPGVFSYDSATGVIGPIVTIPAADPRVSPTYAFGAPYGIDALAFSSSAGPILAYCDAPFCVIVDILPGSPTFNSVIQTINMTDTSIAGDSPTSIFPKFHPSGARIYVSGPANPASPSSVRIARQDVPLPAATLTYSFTPITHPGDKLTTDNVPFSGDLAGEFGTIITPPAVGPASALVNCWGIDIDPFGTKLYVASHFEAPLGGVPTNFSQVNGFTVDSSGDFVASLSVTELPSAEFNHCYYVAFSPSTLTYDSGGSRCYVSNDGVPDMPGAPAPPSPGFVMVIDTLADATTLPVDAGVVPPNIDPSTPLGPTVAPFWSPIGIDCAKGSTVCYVSDQDQTVAPPATDGPIGVKVFASTTPAGLPTVSDKSFLYFVDPTPTDDGDPVHFGVSVDNDDSEVVFCNIGTTPGINNYALDGTIVFVTPTPGGIPVFICCQSGTGSGGPPGGGGGGVGGGSAFNDNGAQFNESGGSGRKHKRCGLTGIEGPLLFGLWLLARRRSKKSAK